MKKIILILVCFACMLALAACGQQDDNTQMVNPITEYKNLTEINEKAGTNLVGPAVMGKTDESFTTISGGELVIAQYRYSLNGLEYCFRGAESSEDISGVYDGQGLILDGKEKDVIIATDNYKVARWFDEEIQYCLFCDDKDNTLSPESFADFVSEIKTIQAQ